MCCKAIMLHKPMTEIKSMLNSNDAIFIAANWEQISTKELLTRNPYLYNMLVKVMIMTMGYKRLSFPVNMIEAPMHEKLGWYNENRKSIARETNLFMFKCNQYNEESKECMVHETRPRVCSDYPVYQHVPPYAPVDELLYDPNCGYKHPDGSSGDEYLKKLRG